MNSGNQRAWQTSEDRLDRPEGIWAFLHWNSLENSVWSMTAVIGGIAIFLTILLLIDWLIRQPAALAESGKNHEQVEHVSLAMQSEPPEKEVQTVPEPIEPNYEPIPEPVPEDDEEVSPFWPGGTVLTEEPEKNDEEEAFDPFSFTDVPTPEAEEKIIPEPDPMIDIFWPTEDIKAPVPVEIPLPEPEVPEFEQRPILPEFTVEEPEPVEIVPIIEPTPEPSLSLSVTQTDWLPDDTLPPDGLLNVSANSKFEPIVDLAEPVWGDINWQQYAKRDFKAEDAAYAKSLEPVVKEVKSQVSATASTVIQKIAPDLKITMTNLKTDMQQGTNHTFEITLQNHGNASTEQFILGARLPDILSHKYGQDVEQSVASLAPGASITLPLIVRTDEAGIGQLEIFAMSNGERLSSSSELISVSVDRKTDAAAKPISQAAPVPNYSPPKCLCE